MNKKTIGGIFGVIILAGVFFLLAQKQFFLGAFIDTDDERVIQEIKQGNRLANNRCDIRDYGAIESVSTQATAAINQAIVDCSQKGGGTVVIPQGKWFSGAITLKSHITLLLEEGSSLIFSPDVRDYLPVVFTRFQGMELHNYSSLVYGFELEDIAIIGTGKLIGNGEDREGWDGGGDFGKARARLYELSEEGTPVAERVFGDRMPGIRPSFVQCVRCQNILLEGFTVENGPFWTIHLIYSENVIARKLHINTWSINTDGMVIDSTKNVLIEDSYFATGDDAIAIKSGADADGRRVNIPSENIEIRRIHVARGNGGVSLGSEMSGGIRNVTVRDSLFENVGSGFRMKANGGRGGFFQNILVENVEMNHVANDAINIDFQYHSALKSKTTVPTTVENIVLKNIRGANIQEAIIDIDGLSSFDMQELRLEDIHFDAVEYPVRIEYADNIVLKNITFSGTKNTSYVIENSKNISLEQSECQTQGTKPCIRLIGEGIENIRIKGMSVLKGRVLVMLESGVIQEAVMVTP